MSVRDKAKQGQIVNISNKAYYFRCDFSIASRFFGNNDYGIKLTVRVYELDENENIVRELTHNQLKGTYISEKIEDFIQNAVNGQPTFYWDWSKNPLKSEVRISGEIIGNIHEVAK